MSDTLLMRTATYAFALQLATYTGCAVGPNYQRPPLAMPDRYRGVDAQPTRETGAASLAAQGWRAIYRDEKLMALIERGLTNNLDLAVARSRVRESRKSLTVSRSPLYPQLSVETEGGREQKSAITSSAPGPVNTFSLDGLLSWELDIWGATRRSVEAAEADWLASRESRLALEVSLIGQIARAYFELLDIDNRLAISERTLELRRESLGIAQLRFQGGMTSELEVQQSLVELASTRATLPDLKRQRQAKENQLSILLGLAPGDIERDLASVSETLPPDVPVGLPSSLLERRPDVRQAEQRLVAANARIGVAMAEFFPKFSLSGSYGRTSDSLDTLLESSGETWTVTWDTNTEIFTAGANRALLAIAREQREQAKLEFKRVVLQSLREVSDSLDGYGRSGEAMEARDQLVHASQRYADLARLRHMNGVLEYLDVLDAQRQLFNAQLSLSESRRDRLVALVELYKALGGGWE